MKHIPVRILAFAASVLVLCSFFPGDKSEQKDKTLMKVLFENLSQSHFLAVNIDDAFSEKVFDLYLKRMDVNKRFLIKDDVDKLKKYRTQIDNEINEGSLEFFDLSLEMLSKRIKDGQEICKDLLSRPFDLKSNESVETDPDKKDFPKDTKALREEWRKMLKYELISRIDEQLSIQEKAEKEKDTAVKIKSIVDIEKESREKIGKKYEDWFKRISKEDRDDKMSVYLNCMTNVYDPHSDFFPPKDKENFDITMSGRLEGIGATLQEKDSYIKVASIVPGSPSWKQGQLKEGDLILKVAQGAGEPVDLVDMRLDEAVKLIRGKKGTEVRLTVKKPDNSIVVIPIIRDEVILEDTFAKSSILEIPGSTNKIGYLYLPTFYADFENPNGRRCAKDVKAELEKLKKAGITGLIFDLRNDGGGSLQDAVEIAGLFIEKGPIVQVKARSGSPYVFDDRDSDIQYDGPLMVMVNSFSASASEIFAAAMQDYGRGVIVGTPSTYGKGTVQRFVDLDKSLSKDETLYKPIGSLKVTIQKFYRINGGSTQLKGVTPDIIFPDAFAYVERGEKEADYPMQWTKIEPVQYTKWKETLPIETIRSQVNEKIKKDSSFILISENAQRLKEFKENSTISLNFDKYRDQQKKWKADSKRYERVGKDTLNIHVINLKEDLVRINADSASMTRNKSWTGNLKKDVYLFQTALAMDKNMAITKR